jgi:hypothetical protein
VEELMFDARRPTLIMIAAAISVCTGCIAESPASDARGGDDDEPDGKIEPPGDPDADEADLPSTKPDAGPVEDSSRGGKTTVEDASASDGARSREDAGDGGSTAEADSGAVAAGCEVLPISDDMRNSYPEMKNAYYKKYASANGVIVGTGEGVDDEAVVRYCRLLLEMFSHAELRAKIVSEKMWFTMIAEDEQLSSLPQISKVYGTSLNARARGLGGLTPTICAEDSIMCMPGDRWVGDCICPHETGHTMYSSAIARVPALSSRLSAITKDTRSSGRLANAYVWQDGNESGMMAWGVQVWYDCAINGTKGAYHSDINTRAELQKELPEFYEFLAELLPTDRKYDDCYSKP